VQDDIFCPAVGADADDIAQAAEKNPINTLYEAELRDFVRNGAVRELVIERGDNATYRLTARLTWKGGDWHLITARKQIKTWSGLDRLTRHLAGYGNLPSITLHLKERSTHEIA